VQKELTMHQFGADRVVMSGAADVNVACGTIQGRKTVRGTRSAFISAAIAAATEWLRRATDSPETGINPFKADRATFIHPS
jgi:hypothetical protein